MRDVELYKAILGLTPPWTVVDVTLDVRGQQVTVQVRAGDGPFPCPECATVVPGYGRKPRRWRHLDTCQFTTWIEADRKIVFDKFHIAKTPGSRADILRPLVLAHYPQPAQADGRSGQAHPAPPPERPDLPPAPAHQRRAGGREHHDPVGEENRAGIPQCRTPQDGDLLSLRGTRSLPTRNPVEPKLLIRDKLFRIFYCCRIRDLQ